MTPAPAHFSPYPGLAPYSAADAKYFFGRAAETRIISANLLASRLTLLYGSSGVGKSSLLNAGVVSSINARARQEVASRGKANCIALCFSHWHDDPILSLEELFWKTICECEIVCERVEMPQSRNLVDFLGTWIRQIDTDILLIFDQFEESFLYQSPREVQGSFFGEFVRATNHLDLRANFLVSIRDDRLSQLDFFKGRIPTLFSNYLRVSHLTRSSAAEAITKPVQHFNELHRQGLAPITLEPELVSSVLDQVRIGQVSLTEAGRGTDLLVLGEDGKTQEGIETSYMQLVMRRLWEHEMDDHSNQLRLKSLFELGGAHEIIRNHLEEALADLSKRQKDVAAAIFYHLVTPTGGKIAHTADDLAQYADVKAQQASDILSKLSGQGRILRSTSTRYEIFHDVLAPAILGWSRRRLERRRIWRKFRPVLIGLATYVIVNAGILALLIISGDDIAGLLSGRNIKQEVLSQLSSNDFGHLTKGYTMYGNSVFGWLGEGASSTTALWVTADRYYSVVAACDNDCWRITFNVSGSVADQQGSVDSTYTPYAFFRATQTGNVHLTTRMNNCRGDPCMFGYRVYVYSSP